MHTCITRRGLSCYYYWQGAKSGKFQLALWCFLISLIFYHRSPDISPLQSFNLAASLLLSCVSRSLFGGKGKKDDLVSARGVDWHGREIYISSFSFSCFTIQIANCQFVIKTDWQVGLLSKSYCSLQIVIHAYQLESKARSSAD